MQVCDEENKSESVLFWNNKRFNSRHTIYPVKPAFSDHPSFIDLNWPGKVFLNESFYKIKLKYKVRIEVGSYRGFYLLVENIRGTSHVQEKFSGTGCDAIMNDIGNYFINFCFFSQKKKLKCSSASLYVYCPSATEAA